MFADIEKFFSAVTISDLFHVERTPEVSQHLALFERKFGVSRFPQFDRFADFGGGRFAKQIAFGMEGADFPTMTAVIFFKNQNGQAFGRFIPSFDEFIMEESHFELPFGV